MIKRLIFIENWEIPSSLTSDFRADAETVWIASNIRAAYELDRRRIPHRTLHDFYSRDAYVKLGMDNFKRVADFTDFVDKTWREHIPELASSELPIARANHLNLKKLFDSVSLAAFEVKNMLDAVRPSKVYLHCWPISGTSSTLVFRNEESLYAPVIRFQCESSGIPIDFAAVPTVPILDSLAWQGSFKKFILERLSRWLPLVFAFKNILWPLRRYVICNALKKETLQKTIFLIDPAYDVGHIARMMIQKGIGPLRLIDVAGRRLISLSPRMSSRHLAHLELSMRESSRISDQLREVYKRILARPEFQSFFEFSGVNLWRIFEPKLAWFFNESVPDHVFCYRLFFDFFETFAGSKLLLSSGADSLTEMVLRAARQRGLRVYKHQHGSDGYFYFSLFASYSLSNCDAYFAFGEGVKQGIERHFKSEAAILPVGSTSLDLLHRRRSSNRGVLAKWGLDPARPVAVYPLSLLSFNDSYISGQAYTDWDAFEIHKCIVNVFRRHPEVQLVLKAHPNVFFPTSPIFEYITDQGIANCRVIARPPFIDWVGLADLFVFESASTVTLQAMTTAKMILIYNGILQFEPEARQLVRRRCIYEEDLSQFLTALDAALKHRPFVDGPQDREFLKAYGTYLDDGRSAERVQMELVSGMGSGLGELGSRKEKVRLDKWIYPV